MEKSIARQESIFDEIADFFENNKLYLLGVFIVFIAVYGSWMFEYFVTFDAEGFYYEASGADWYAQWVALGRWAFVLLKKLLGVILINPFFSTAIFILCFPLSGILWNFAFMKWSNRRGSVGAGLIIFDIIYLSSPIWAYQFAYRNQMEVVCIVSLLLPLCLLLLTEYLSGKSVLYGLFALAGTVFCFAGYQSFLVLYLEAVIIYFFLRIVSSGINTKDFYAQLIRSIVFTAVAFVLYQISCRVVTAYLNVNTEVYSAYLSSQITWLTEGFRESLRGTLESLQMMFFGDADTFSPILFVELVAAVALYIVYCAKKKQMRIWVGVITFLIFMAPFSLTILTAGNAVIRQQFAFAFAVAFIAAVEINTLFYLLNGKAPRIWAQTICLAISLGIFVTQLQTTTRLLYSDYKTMVADYSVMEEIYYSAIEAGATSGSAIVFVGAMLPGLSANIVRNEVIGFSYFQTVNVDSVATDKLIDAMRAYGFNVVEATDEQKAYAQEVAEDLPCWPDSGSIYVEEGLIVVRLS